MQSSRLLSFLQFVKVPQSFLVFITENFGVPVRHVRGHPSVWDPLVFYHGLTGVIDCWEECHTDEVCFSLFGESIVWVYENL